MNEKTTYIEIKNLHPFAGNPYKVQDNEEMTELTESIREHGVLSPILVRPTENSTTEYEIVSGHRRVMACRKAGITTIPAFVISLDRDGAAILLVDSNLHREHILPSEKAFAYKLKLEALAHRGQTCGQVGHKSREEISDTDSGRQVQRYIRLTHLIPELLQYVDDGKIALTPAVEVSYLTQQEQSDLLETMECEDCTPSLSQAILMKRLSQTQELDIDIIFDILREPKANQRDKISFRVDDLRKFFPNGYSTAKIQEAILKLLGDYARRRQQSRGER